MRIPMHSRSIKLHAHAATHAEYHPFYRIAGEFVEEAYAPAQREGRLGTRLFKVRHLDFAPPGFRRVDLG